MADPVPVASLAEPTIDAWVLSVPDAAEDEASGRIWDLGCTGITIEKSGTDTVRLVCFFAEPEAHEDGMRTLAAAFGSVALRVPVPNPDWVLRFRQTFVAFDAPPFRIAPEWLDEPGSSALRLRVDPGRAFGTGTHESTRLCLQTLGSLARSFTRAAPRVLDLGCGTGILGIGAVKLLGASVVACDHDALATASTVRHAALNGVRLEVAQTDGCRGVSGGRFDLVFANLMAPLLIERAAEIGAAGAPGCRFILAGLLREEEAAVKAAWPGDWTVASSHLGEWASLLYQRP